MSATTRVLSTPILSIDKKPKPGDLKSMYTNAHILGNKQRNWSSMLSLRFMML